MAHNRCLTGYEWTRDGMERAERAEQEHKHARRLSKRFPWLSRRFPNKARRTGCSCWMCGNPRKYFGDLSRQEQTVQSAERCDARAMRRLELNDEQALPSWWVLRQWDNYENEWCVHPEYEEAA